MSESVETYSGSANITIFWDDNHYNAHSNNVFLLRDKDAQRVELNFKEAQASDIGEVSAQITWEQGSISGYVKIHDKTCEMVTGTPGTVTREDKEYYGFSGSCEFREGTSGRQNVRVAIEY
ncbi:MAG: hypothetical protein RIB93_20680 [Coleofasciculus sp. D1-CHI-01]|uniref:hypothetical protein n=1 Tax=unclassified Coleofasciculus TaxID=2692782 RepID=UPI0032F76A2B